MLHARHAVVSKFCKCYHCLDTSKTISKDFIYSADCIMGGVRRFCTEAIAIFRRHMVATQETSSTLARNYSSLPEDISQASRKAKFPERKIFTQHNTSNHSTTSSSPQPVTNTAAPSIQQEGAQIGK